MRALQNEVIRTQLPPPREYVEQMRDAFSQYRDGAAMLEAMLSDFQPVATPYRQQQGCSPSVLPSIRRAAVVNVPARHLPAHRQRVPGRE